MGTRWVGLLQKMLGALWVGQRGRRLLMGLLAKLRRLLVAGLCRWRLGLLLRRRLQRRPGLCG